MSPIVKLRCFLTAQLTPIVLSIAVLLPAVAWASEFDTYNTLELLCAQVDQQGEDIEKLLEELSKQRTEIQSLLDDAGNKAAEEGASGDGTVTPTQADSGGDLQADDSMDVVARVSRLEETLLGITSKREDFLESPSSQSTRIVNGRIHIDQWSFPDSSPSINVLETGSPDTDPLDRLIYRRIRFGVGGTVPPGNMSFRVQIEFSAEDGSTFRDAWIGWDDLAYLGTIRLGNQKRPYGLDHLNSSNFTIFMERPFIVDAVNENNRRFGLMSYGASAGQAFNWRFGVFDIDLIQNVGSTLNNSYPLELAGRLASTYWYDEISNGRGYGHLAVSSSFAFPNPLPPTGGLKTVVRCFGLVQSRDHLSFGSTPNE